MFSNDNIYDIEDSVYCTLFNHNTWFTTNTLFIYTNKTNYIFFVTFNNINIHQQ